MGSSTPIACSTPDIVAPPAWHAEPADAATSSESWIEVEGDTREAVVSEAMIQGVRGKLYRVCRRKPGVCMPFQFQTPRHRQVHQKSCCAKYVYLRV